MTNLTSIDIHAKFATVAAMDEATNQHIYANYNELNKTDRAVLDLIRRYSSIYRAAKIKVATIADLVGKSAITVRRATAKLIRLNIIESIQTKRPINVGRGANIYVILPYNDKSETTMPGGGGNSTPVKAEDVKSIRDPLSFNKTSKQSLHDTFQNEPTIYERFQSILSNTIGDNKTTRLFYGVYRAHSVRQLRFSHNADKENLLASLGIQALNITMQATKKKAIHNLVGYYDGVLRGLFDKTLFSEAFKEYSVNPVRLCTH